MPDIRGYVSIAEAAQLLGVHKTAVYQYIEAGYLHAVDILGKKAVLEAELRQLTHQIRKTRNRWGESVNERECDNGERGLLGVPFKTTGSYRGEFPPPDIPVIMNRGISLPPPDKRRRDIVGISEEALQDALDRFADNPEQQNDEREKLLAKVGFDAKRPYEVIHVILRSVYFFRYLSPSETNRP